MSTPTPFQLSIRKKADGPAKAFGEYPTLPEATAIADALVKARAAHTAEVTQVVYRVSAHPTALPGDQPLPMTGTDQTTDAGTPATAATE